MLHYFLATPDVWRQPEDDLLAGFIGVAEALAPALGVMIAHHLIVEDAGPLIIEGDGIAPGLIGERSPVLGHMRDAALMSRVRALVVDETDEDVIFANMLARGCATRREHACAWLRDEARTYRALVILAHPLETLFERTLALLEK